MMIPIPRPIEAIPMPFTGPITFFRFLFGLLLMWLSAYVLTKEQGGYMVEVVAGVAVKRHPDAFERLVA